MAPKTVKRGKRNEKKEDPLDFGGLDPNMMLSLMRKIPPNAVTGRVELMDIVKYMEENPSEMEQLMNEVDKHEIGSPKVDLEIYNYSALARTIKTDAEWVIQLESMGFVDGSGNPVDPDGAHSSTGVQPTFILYCYDDTGAYRITHECIGLPDSKTVLQTIQRAIAEPCLPLKPGLPSHLLISVKLTPHIAAIKPFLDSLPAPFRWRLETRQEAEGVHEGVHALNQQGVQTGLVLAEKAKTAGNKAFSQKDRRSAIKAYSEALSHLVDVLSQKPNDEDEKKAINLRAICFANRAATYLVPGDGMNLKKALEDGKAAEAINPSYAKAYIRQSTALQRLGKMDDAQDAIVRALRRKDLENDAGLVDCLVDLLTAGQGFPEDEGRFKNWMLDVLINNRKSAERLNGLGGEWRRRCDAQFSKYTR